MISPDFLITYAKAHGIYYLYDVNGDGQIDMRDVDRLKLAQSATDYHMRGWKQNGRA
jgi:hypothetical protein